MRFEPLRIGFANATFAQHQLFAHLFVAFLVFAVAIPAFGDDKATSNKPNIILIMADDLGYECLSTNGSTSYRTPVLDELAKSGMRFRHCYSQPLCTPSRVKIMTGMYNVRNYVQFGKLDRKQTTFAHILKKAGYQTCVVGKWQLGQQVDSPRHFGFDESCLWQHTRKATTSRFPNPGLETNGKETDYHNGEYGPDVVSDYACDFIERNKDKPFFVYYPMILTHCPFEPTPDSKDWNAKSKGSKTYKGKAKYFGDMVVYMDKIVGKLVAKLEELDLRDKTLILFTGDNGTDKPVVSQMGDVTVAGAKGKMTDGGTRVPLIANWPTVIQPGNVCDDLVDFSDFLPTICDATDATIPESLNIDGRSFLPQLKGQRGTPREWIYIWYTRSGKPGTEKVFVRNQRYKLYADGRFFDVKSDRLEKSPLEHSVQHRDTIDKFQKVIDRYASTRPPVAPRQKAGKRKATAQR